MQVLVAEDNRAVRHIVSRTIENWGHQVVGVADGLAAWGALHQANAPRLVILDWMMPGMDGLEICRRLRAEGREPYTYVILHTSREGTEALAAGMEAGADDYIVKATDMIELRGRLRAGERILQLQEQLRARHAELAEKRRSEIMVGKRIQETLLLGRAPTDVPGLDMASLTVPAECVDGDFCDFIRYGRDVVDVLVGDVMGKGVPAALLGAAAKAHFLRAIGQLALEGQGPACPRQIVSAVSSQMAEHMMDMDSFVTLCYARFDAGGRRMTWVDCGHPPVLHYVHSRRSTVPLKTRGRNLPLGISAEETYQEERVELEAGDALVFYSDGITEARNVSNELFGIQRAGEVVTAASDRTAQGILDALTSSVRAFSKQDAYQDDLTCVVVKVTDQ